MKRTSRGGKTLRKTLGSGSQADNELVPEGRNHIVGAVKRTRRSCPRQEQTQHPHTWHTQPGGGIAYLAAARRRQGGSPGGETRYKGAAGVSCLRSA